MLPHLYWALGVKMGEGILKPDLRFPDNRTKCLTRTERAAYESKYTIRSRSASSHDDQDG